MNKNDFKNLFKMTKNLDKLGFISHTLEQYNEMTAIDLLVLLGEKDVSFFQGDDPIPDLKRYLMSEKFHKDTTVQVSDVLKRLEE